MAKNWDSESCNEKSGFLFSHECFRSPERVCSSCQKPVCEDHGHDVNGEWLCTACTKKYLNRSGEYSGRNQGRSSYYYDNVPYFYGGYYYGYGYYDTYHSTTHSDPSDFTEADAESLSSEADQDFENDMSES